MNMAGNEIPVNKHNILLMPSMVNEKRLPMLGNQATSVCRYSGLCKTAMPNMATTMVMMDVNNDHTFTPFSCLIRKASKPLTNGITISNTGTIISYKIRETSILFFQKELHYKQREHAQHHQQYIITNQSAL